MRPIRIANCSGFLGDRATAAREMIDDGPIDVLTGDWLAELTMLILAKQRMKRPGTGYARPFLTQLRDILADSQTKGIKIISNAGGLDPQELTKEVIKLAQELGLSLRVATVVGDDLMPRLKDLFTREQFVNFDTGQALGDAGAQPLTANVYLGGDGIAQALAEGADVVITGRVTDAALAIGAAAWWHSWQFDDAHCDRLAGALAAGHVIECGAQATGGNYAFFGDFTSDFPIGFPIAEIAADGTSVITKHANTGGMVTPGTVTAQMLYEVGEPWYANPDVSADFSSVHVRAVGANRVRLSGTRGMLPPERYKVSMNYLGGFRNSATLVLTGLDIERKADMALAAALGVSLADCELPAEALAEKCRLPLTELAIRLVRSDSAEPSQYNDSQALLEIRAKAADADQIGKAFTTAIIGTALASYPGLYAAGTPTPAQPYGVFWPTTIARDEVHQRVEVWEVKADEATQIGDIEIPNRADFSHHEPVAVHVPSVPPHEGPVVTAPLGTLVGARSGDKAGNANIGIWVPDPAELEAVAIAGQLSDVLVSREVTDLEQLETIWATDAELMSGEVEQTRADLAYQWLVSLVSDHARLAKLFPKEGSAEVEVAYYPNLRAVNIILQGWLDGGVSANLLPDPQAKALGEFVRAQSVDIPLELFEESALSHSAGNN